MFECAQRGRTIATLATLFLRGGPVQDPVLTNSPFYEKEPHKSPAYFRIVSSAPMQMANRVRSKTAGPHLDLFLRVLPGNGKGNSKHGRGTSKLPCRKAGQPSHLVDVVDSDQ